MMDAFHGIRSFAAYARSAGALLGRRLVPILLLMLLASMFDGVGIALFFPLLEGLRGNGATADSRTLAWVFQFLAVLHLTSTGVIAGFIVAIFLAKFFVLFLQEYTVQRTLQGLYRSVAGRLLRGWAASDYARHYLTTTTGYFSNLLVRELDTFLGAFTHFSAIAVSAIQLVVYLVLAMAIDATTTAIAVIGGGAMVIGFRRAMRAMEQLSRQVTEEHERYQGRIIEFVQAQKYLKATHRASPFILLLESHIGTITAARLRMAFHSVLLTTAAEPIAIVLLFVLLFVQVTVFAQPFSIMVVLLLLFYRTIVRIARLQGNWQKFLGCAGALDRVPDALTRIDTEREPMGTQSAAPLMRAIALRDVHYAYGDREVLHGVNLELRTHTTTAIVGRSGAGKSTIIDLVTGVLHPTRGTILWDTQSYAALDRTTIRARLGYVVQEVLLFHGTITENVTGWEAHPNFDRLRAACADAACDFIERLPAQYETPLHDRAVNLSVGQRQRLAIARELYRDPDLLIFDEATSALDAESERAVHETIARLHGKKTILLIAHQLATLRDVDSVYVLDQGRVVEAGTFASLAGNPRSTFAQMLRAQIVV